MYYLETDFISSSLVVYVYSQNGQLEIRIIMVDDHEHMEIYGWTCDSLKTCLQLYTVICTLITMEIEPWANHSITPLSYQVT